MNGQSDSTYNVTMHKWVESIGNWSRSIKKSINSSKMDNNEKKQYLNDAVECLQQLKRSLATHDDMQRYIVKVDHFILELRR